MPLYTAKIVRFGDRLDEHVTPRRRGVVTGRPQKIGKNWKKLEKMKNQSIGIIIYCKVRRFERET